MESNSSSIPTCSNDGSVAACHPTRLCAAELVGRATRSLWLSQLNASIAMRTRRKPTVALFAGLVCPSVLACGGTNKSRAAPPPSRPPCPNGYHCAADVIVKDLKSGKMVCHPTYCVAGPDPIRELDLGACKPRRTPP